MLSAGVSASDSPCVRYDVVSVVLSALAFGGIIYGLSQFGEAE